MEATPRRGEDARLPGYLSGNGGLLVVVVGVLITVSLAVAALVQAPVRYQADGRLLVGLPGAAEGNASQLVVGGVQVVADLALRSVSSASSEQSLRDAGLDAEYSVAMLPGGRSAALIVQTRSPDAEQAEATRDELLDRLEGYVEAVQAQVGVPRGAEVVTRRVAAEASAQPVRGDPYRAVVGTVAAGLLLTVGAAGVVSRLPTGREQSRPSWARKGPRSRGPDVETSWEWRHRVPE